MQKASQAWKSSMKESGFRRPGYIKAYIGVINQIAQKEAHVTSDLTFYSDSQKPFDGFEPEAEYVTMEENFTRTDGSQYFLPSTASSVLFNNGLVSNAVLGDIIIAFDTHGLDIKGLTIDFSESYPVDFTVSNDITTYNYTGNDSRYWRTEDVFNGTSFIRIHPTRMLNGQNRLRIYKFSCGIANTFANAGISSYSLKEHISPISESLPSVDMTLQVFNYDRYYSADNPNSALAYMEQGQEITVSMGYDSANDGNIEWMPAQTVFMKTWSANDQTAQFTGVDIFDYITTKYYRGKYHPEGISLYDLAIDVLTDAGIDEEDYFVDQYLRSIIVNNPLPVVPHTQALQIIANAGRCVIQQNRDKQIRIVSEILPKSVKKVATSDNQTDFSDVGSILIDKEKSAYGMHSRNFSTVNNETYILPSDSTEYRQVGYVSNSVADDNGLFDENPAITVNLEAGITMVGMAIEFRNEYAEEFTVATYYNGEFVESFNFTADSENFETDQTFEMFDKMVIEFTKGRPNARVTIDRLVIGEPTDYHITYHDVTGSTPTSERQNKIKSVTVQKTMYSLNSEEEKDLHTETIDPVESSFIHRVNFNNPSYGFSASIHSIDDEEAEPIPMQIVDSSSYYADVQITGVTPGTQFKLVITGKTYVQDTASYTKMHSTNGEEKEWKNPLVSTTEHASQLEEWLAEYFLNEVEYSFAWRGDPRVDANDLFYLERKDMDEALIRSYENSINFNGGWTGNISARKVM